MVKILRAPTFAPHFARLSILLLRLLWKPLLAVNPSAHWLLGFWWVSRSPFYHGSRDFWLIPVTMSFSVFLLLIFVSFFISKLQNTEVWCLGQGFGECICHPSSSIIHIRLCDKFCLPIFSYLHIHWIFHFPIWS